VLEKGQAKWGQVSNLPPLGFRGCLIEEAFGGVMRGGACRCEFGRRAPGRVGNSSLRDRWTG